MATCSHLFFNMLALWMFGAEIERLWGGKRYMHFLLASSVAAAVVQLLWTLLIGSRVPTLGASGATYGLLLAFGMLFPNRTIMLLIPPIPMKAKFFVAIFGDARTGAGRDGPQRHRALRPPGRHAGRLPDDSLLARPGAVRSPPLSDPHRARALRRAPAWRILRIGVAGGA